MSTKRSPTSHIHKSLFDLFRVLLNTGLWMPGKGEHIEFTLLREMLKVRKNAGLSQAEVAKRMGTKSTAITRLESSLGSGKHSPSIATLKKYAEAMGCHLDIKFVQNNENSRITSA